MSAPNVTRWIGIGLLGLPLYGALTFYSSINPQPDYNTHLEAWARYVTTNHYVLSHLFSSILGIIFAIFGVFALGAYLAASRAGRIGFVGNILLGVAIWRSGTLPRWAGALWAAAHVLMYVGQGYAETVGAKSTPPTVLVGAVLVVISGAWMAYRVMRGPSARAVSVGAQPRVQ